jgi:hypothetical protein
MPARKPEECDTISVNANNKGDLEGAECRLVAVALLIRVAALLASASFSKSNNAEYLRPTTCAITLEYRAGYGDWIMALRCRPRLIYTRCSA